ncbi:ATP-dependent nuclease [Labilibaculum euxinus]
MTDKEIKHPRLHKLIIKNFRTIGEKPVEIELDDIVVLVGANNAGKSSILKAYEIVMSEGSKECQLAIEDFPNHKIIEDKYPEIELQTIVYDNSPGEKWLIETDNKEKLVREKWTWTNIGKPVRFGFDSQENRWANDSDKSKVPWGAPNIANSRRPKPHIIEAFASPEEQTKQVIGILVSILNERVKTVKEDSAEDSTYNKLISTVKSLQNSIVEECLEQINKIQEELSSFVGKVFPTYEVEFDAKPEENLESTINFFKTNPQLLIGPSGGFKSPIERQGSGARRTLLWTALRIVAENQKTAKDENRPHVLLLDEPEICLHPNAVRESCDLLYSLPKNDNWQVMVTTHSPQFIDISRDNTTIIRVARNDNGDVFGTTIFRPERANLTNDDRQNLKLLNIYDPYVGEFFFGAKIIIVEGDTEYSAFRYVISENKEQYKNVHIIRARGKSTIISLAKILNQFGASYSVLHDSDYPTCIRREATITNPAWTNNSRILEEVQKGKGEINLISSIPHFEGAYYNEELRNEKPYTAISKIKENKAVCESIEALLSNLCGTSDKLPENAIKWNDIKQLEDKVKRLTHAHKN